MGKIFKIISVKIYKDGFPEPHDTDEAMKYPFRKIMQMIKCGHDLRKISKLDDDKIGELMKDVDCKVSDEWVNRVIPLELQGVFMLAYYQQNDDGKSGQPS